MRSIPPNLAARIDLLQPTLATGFGPLNGQELRQSILRTLLRSYPFDLVIETGTYRGTTTEWLRAATSSPIVTIESSKRYYEYARKRLSPLADTRVVLGDSPAEIRCLASSPAHDDKARVFAYLDAHWRSTLPVRYELLELFTGWDVVCAVIDDFKVPADPTYGYDDYGPGLVLDRSVLSGLPLGGVSLFYPNVPSIKETGFRRGWVVLGRGSDLVRELTKVEGLVNGDMSTKTGG